MFLFKNFLEIRYVVLKTLASNTSLLIRFSLGHFFVPLLFNMCMICRVSSRAVFFLITLLVFVFSCDFQNRAIIVDEDLSNSWRALFGNIGRILLRVHEVIFCEHGMTMCQHFKRLRLRRQISNVKRTRRVLSNACQEIWTRFTELWVRTVKYSSRYHRDFFDLFSSNLARAYLEPINRRPHKPLSYIREFYKYVSRRFTISLEAHYATKMNHVYMSCGVGAMEESESNENRMFYENWTRRTHQLLRMRRSALSFIQHYMQTYFTRFYLRNFLTTLIMILAQAICNRFLLWHQFSTSLDVFYNSLMVLPFYTDGYLFPLHLYLYMYLSYAFRVMWLMVFIYFLSILFIPIKALDRTGDEMT